MSKEKKHSKTHLRGFFRVNIEENGRVVGDTGWMENQVTNDGIQDFLVKNLIGSAGAKSVSHMALGTGGAPASNATTLSGEIEDVTNHRKAVTASIVSSRTAQFTAAFNSTDSFLTATKNISNVGLFASSAQTAGTVFAGNTYASSSVATNQNVNVTYQIRFTSA